MSDIDRARDEFIVAVAGLIERLTVPVLRALTRALDWLTERLI